MLVTEDTLTAISLTSAAEHARLLDQHNALVALVKGRIVHAPITAPTTILEVGCGTGVITRYLATHFPPTTHVYGIDLCPVPSSPTDASLPNLTFILGNFRTLAGKDPRLQPNTFDLVYSRLLLCGMTDWPGYVRDMFAMLKPGGWADFGDYIEDVFYTDARCQPREDWEWLRAIRLGGDRKGLDLDCGANVRRYMQEAGFVDIERWEYRVPLWKKVTEDRGEQVEARLVADNLIGDKWGLHWHMLPRMLEGMGYGEEGIGRLREEMRVDKRDEEGKYQLFFVTVGRKPV